jgi:putative transcriptional regulator
MTSGWMVWAGIVAGLCSVGTPLRAADEQLASGKILVADRNLRDPHFAGTVIVLINYDDDGAVGLILNRQSETPVTRVLDGVKEAAGRKDLVFEGGPVETKSVLALVRSREKPAGAQHLFADVYAVLGEGALKKTLAAGAGSNLLRFYMGYAGWGPGQLDDEVDAGAWHIFTGDPNTVFDSDPDTLWDRLIHRTSLSVARSIPFRANR